MTFVLLKAENVRKSLIAVTGRKVEGLSCSTCGNSKKKDINTVNIDKIFSSEEEHELTVSYLAYFI